LTPNFTQRPACGYAITENLVWTIPGGAPITANPTNKYQITASSTTPSHHNSYTLVFTDQVTYGAQSFSPSVTFTFKVTDPCRTSTITAITVASPWDVVLGTIGEKTYTEAVDSAATAQGTASICGPRKYEVLNASSQSSHLVTI